MIEISRYMDDGAGWQEQAVLAYVRKFADSVKDIEKPYRASDEEKVEIERLLSFMHFEVGRYENCREQGYIFSARYDGKQRNYCVYEHRNSDELCVVVFDAATLNTPKAETVFNAMNGDKYNVTNAFEYGRITECGDYILDDMKKWIDGLVENKED
jgi:hypothetical protein